MKRDIRGFAHLLLVIAIVVVGIAGIGYWAYRNGQINLAPTKNQKDDLSPTTTPKSFEDLSRDEVIRDWITYKNEKYGFEIKYPENWNLDYYPSSSQAETANIVLFDKLKRNGYTPEQVTVGILANNNPRNLPIRNFITDGQISIDYPSIGDFFDAEKEREYREKRVQEMQDTTFMEFEALQDGENRLFVNTGDRVFLIYINSLSTEGVLDEDKQIFNQILSTFEFIENTVTSDQSRPLVLMILV